MTMTFHRHRYDYRSRTAAGYTWQCSRCLKVKPGPTLTELVGAPNIAGRLEGRDQEQKRLALAEARRLKREAKRAHVDAVLAGVARSTLREAWREADLSK